MFNFSFKFLQQKISDVMLVMLEMLPLLQHHFSMLQWMFLNVAVGIF